MSLDLKKEAKQTIQELIDKFEKLTPVERKNYNEANTRKNFILPMFQSLGWDIHEDVLEEDPAISGRVDYSFRLNHITQFLLEAKSISENLDKEQWAKQTVEYGWNRGVPWVVLTDFEGLKLFNSELNTTHPKPIFDFSYTDYLDNFDKLWLLSKESLEQNLLDTTLTGFGIGNRRTKINDVLASDLVKWRDLLTSNLTQWNEKVDIEIIKESVQRILDRLIFIRVVEDKGIEDKFLWQIFQKWKVNPSKEYNFIKLLVPLFREFDKKYNSNLFLEHYCEELNTEGTPFRYIIPDLYTNKDQQVSYRFDAINADVLGKVYEQYLGYLQKGREDKGKRKKQGIYYTPSYIVDYIVRNTIGKILEGSSNYDQQQSIKILDPACGSGSFLIHSFDYLDNYFRKLNHQNIGDHNASALRKYRILSENIYGIDLDEQAVEIARLNLLLQAVVPNFKLPLLNNHLHVGNSLIEDNKVTDKAFNWKKEFADVFDRDNPGFDVIVGNPPYIKEFVNRHAFDDLHDNPYYQGKMDLWTLFACKSIDLLRDGGYLSFIAPNNWISNAGASIFRDKILKEGEIQSFIDFGDYKVFEDAGIQTMIFVFKKQTPKNTYNCRYLKISNSKATENDINQQIQKIKDIVKINVKDTLGHNITFSSGSENNILEKIKNSGTFYLAKNEVAQGIVGDPDKAFIFQNKDNFHNGESDLLKPYFTAVNKYLPGEQRGYIAYLDKKVKDINNYPNIKIHINSYEKNLNKRREVVNGQIQYFHLHWPRDEKFFIKGEKIIGGIRVKEPSFFYTTEEYYGSRALNFIQTDRINLKYLTAILNSKIVHYWLLNKGKRLGDLLQVDKGPLLNIPIAQADSKTQKEIIVLVDKILSLKAILSDIALNSDKYRKVEDEIKEIDDKINKLVYKIYELNKDEISEIETSLDS